MTGRVRTQLRKEEMATPEVTNSILMGIYLRMEELERNSSVVEEEVAIAATTPPITVTFGASELENATRYMSIGGPHWPYAGGNIATSPVLWPCPMAGTVTQFQLQFSATIAETAGVTTFTVQKTGVGLTTTPTDTSMVIVVTFSAVTGTRHYAVTTIGSFAVALGDTLSIKIGQVGPFNAAVEGIAAVLTLTPD